MPQPRHIQCKQPATTAPLPTCMHHVPLQRDLDAPDAPESQRFTLRCSHNYGMTVMHRVANGHWPMIPLT